MAELELQHLTTAKLPRRAAGVKPFIGPDQAYKLAYVLTGKELSEANLKPLVEALLECWRVLKHAGKPTAVFTIRLNFAAGQRKRGMPLRPWA